MPESKQRRRQPHRRPRQQPPEGKDRAHKRARVREYFRLGGLIVGLLVGYKLKDFLGLRGRIATGGCVVLGGVAGAYLMSTLYIYLFGEPPADEKSGKGDGKEEGGDNYFKTVRETAESIVIALILAFLFRAFEAEAFVIPTGSMAPTLMGRHKDLTCPISGVEYQAGASVENDDNWGGPKYVLAAHDPYYRYRRRVEYDDYNPRYKTWDVADKEERSFNGDRIIVSKFAYEFSDPERWDVIVFKYPGNPKQNYIKRLIGLPEETIWIRHGDILLADQLFRADRSLTESLSQGNIDSRLRLLFKKHDVELPSGVTVKQSERSLSQAQYLDGEWQIRHPEMDEMYFVRTWNGQKQAEVLEVTIARKPPRKLRAMLQRVDDTRYFPQLLIDANWPARWQPWQPPAASGVNPWKLLDGGRSFEVSAPEGKPGKQPVAWLRYRHMMPTEMDWYNITGEGPEPLPRHDETLLEGVPVADRNGQLITDYYAYNDEQSPQTMAYHASPDKDPDREPVIRADSLAGMHWVGDLAVEADVNVKSKQGYLWLQLIEGGRAYRCRIDVSSGEATISIDDGKVPFTCNGAVRGVKELTADTKIKKPGTYHVRLANCDDQLFLWVDNSARKFRVGGKGSVVEATYANVVDRQPVFRPEEPGDLMPVGIGSQGVSLHVERIRVLRDIYYVADTVSGGLLTDYLGPNHPSEVMRIFRTPGEWSTTDLFRLRRTIEYSLGPDQFFPLGDNSPASKDGRLWDNGHFVDRRYLTGKALFIYWPHSWDRPIPFFPNFRRMGFVR